MLTNDFLIELTFKYFYIAFIIIHCVGLTVVQEMKNNKSYVKIFKG